MKADIGHRLASRRSFLVGASSLGLVAYQPAWAAASIAPLGVAAFNDADVLTAVAAGDITDTVFDPAPGVGRYLGNGRFGAVFGKLGLHAHPSERKTLDPYGKTQFMHMRHYGRFKFHSEFMKRDTSADYLIPLGRIYWETVPMNVSSYRQHQSFGEGTLETAFAFEGTKRITVTNWFDAEDRDLAGIEVQAQGPAPAILIDATEPFIPYNYGRSAPAEASVQVSRAGDQWRLEISCAETNPIARSVLFVKTNAVVTIVPQGLRIAPGEGASSILLSYGKPVSSSAAASRQRTRQWWRQTWLDSASFTFPEPAMQAMWVRSMAYILSTFNDDGIGFAPTNGLTGNLFPFNFAQDMLYVHPALLASGRVEVARSWMERFHAMIPEMRAYAKKLWPQVEGIYPPWELPFGPVAGYHEPTVPIVYCYEPHNAGYLSRMAHETAIAIDDSAWTKAIARPLISEVARYYRSFCTKGTDGNWHFALTPAVGQDEAGGQNQPDYLCVLYSAQYSFQRAVEHGLDPDGAYAAILKDGLAFPSLLAEQGFYYTSAGAGPKDFGRQKHPVQLNALAYLPVASEPSGPDRVGYRLRHDITQDAKKPYFYGWTLGEMLLAGTRMGDVAGWSLDWSKLAPSRYIDPKAVQIYESSAEPFKAFYVTTHGLVATSLMENLVSDYWGELRVGQCNPAREAVTFRNVRSLSGLLLSGRMLGRAGAVQVKAWKDTDAVLHGLRLKLRKGEQKSILIEADASGTARARIAT